MATDWNNLGAVYFLKKNYKKAVEYLEKALLIHEKFLGTDHPKIRNTRLGLQMAKKKLSALE